MKQIIIKEFNDFINSKRPSNLFNRNTMRGYWNMFIWSEEAEQWLVDNNIKYAIEND